jgi:hypothetical protein
MDDLIDGTRELFRQHTTETVTDWRLGCIPPRPDGHQTELFRSAIAEIIGLRLRIAYMPLFQGLARIEARVAILTSIREDPYAPPRRPGYLR